MDLQNLVELCICLLPNEKRSIMVNVKHLDDIHSFMSFHYNLFKGTYYLRKNGRVLSCNEELNGSIQVELKLCGGKGGFGSMLRAIGAQIEKTTNREACRDLSGRRLRDINEEQRLKKWISQQADREREAEERKKKKLEKLSAEPKFEFADQIYEEERADLVEKISDSVEQGIKASTSKRKSTEPEQPKKKKKKFILDFDEDLSSSDDSVSEEQSERTTSDIAVVKETQ